MKKISLWTLLSFFVLIFASVSFLPTFFSTDLGRNLALNFVNKKIPGNIEIEHLHLSWLGSQQIDGFRLKEAGGKEVASFAHFKTKTSLLYLLFGGKSLREVVLKSPYLLIEKQAKEEQTNLEKALGAKRKIKSPHGSKKKFFRVKDATLEEGTLTIIEPNIEPIMISDIQLKKEKKPDTFLLAAKTKQKLIEGSIQVKAQCGKNIQIHSEIENFPVAILDQLYKSPLYTEAIGKTLNVSLDINKEKTSFFIDAKAKSTNIEALIKGESAEGKLVLNPESNLKVTLTPGFFNQIVTPSQRQNWILASKSDLNLSVQKGIIPLNLDQLNFKDIVFQAQAKLQRAEIHHHTLGSYSLNNFEISLLSSKNLEIAYKGEIRGKEATEMEGTFSLTPEKKVLFNTNIKGFPISLVEIFSPTAADQLNLLFGKNVDFSYYGTYGEKTVDSHFSISSPSLLLNGNLEGTFPEFSVEMEGKTTLTGEKAKLIGPSLDIKTKGSLDLSKGTLSLPSVSGKLSNPQIEMDFNGKLGEKGEPFRYNQINFEAKGTLKKLLPIDQPIQDGSFTLQVDGAKNVAAGHAQGSFSSSLSELQFEIKEFIQDNKLNFEYAKNTFDFNLRQLPVSLLTPFLPDEVKLNSLIGEFLDINGTGKLYLDKSPHAAIELEAKSTGLSSTFFFDVDKTLKVSLNKPAHIHWEMSPERYESLLECFNVDEDYHPEYLLVKTAPLDLKISKLECPSLESSNLGGFLCKSGLDADVLIGSLVFKRQETNESFIVQDISGSLKGENICHALNVKLEGNLSSPNVPENHSSAFALDGQVINLCTPNGKFNHEKMTFKGELSLDLIPVKQLTEVVPMDSVTRKKIQAVLGEFVNARIYGEISHMTGPLTVDIKASNFKALLPLQLTPHAIYLRDSVDAEITLTEAVNEAIIKDINPIVFTGAFSDHPVKIYIDPQGFMLPIKPYSLQGLQIGRAVIDIGKIRVRNGGQVQALMEFLNAGAEDNMMEAWFTPIFMSLHNGVASYKRFDMLLGGFVHIALWGDINLITDQVNMVLGISPSTIKQKFNIGLTKTELFQVPMKGTTEKLDLDWSSAKTRIGVLIAKSAGGPGGLIIGGIIEQFLGQEVSPPPTTYPFPWDRW